MEEDSTSMTNLDKDVLHEVLIRLPNSKSAIRCSAVCKRWFSVVHDSNFVNAFGESHNNCMQFTFLVKHPSHHTSFYDLLSPKGIKSDCLDFLPRPWRPTIQASCSGFLLLWLGDRNLCVCDPLTRQWGLLPRAPQSSLEATAYGLVLSPNATTCSDTIKFKVVLLVLNISTRLWSALVFCSETGLWTTETMPPLRYPIFGPAEPCNGVLYWQEDFIGCRGVAAHDPFNGSAEYIGLPVGDPGTEPEPVRLGAVRGQLRLSRVTRLREPGGTHALKVWELEDGLPREWRLVHDARPRLLSAQVQVIGLHPDGGAVFLKCGAPGVFRYDFARDAVEKVSEFSIAGVLDRHWACPFRPFALAHPSSWPKLIPKLREKKRERSQLLELEQKGRRRRTRI